MKITSLIIQCLPNGFFKIEIKGEVTLFELNILGSDTICGKHDCEEQHLICYDSLPLHYSVPLAGQPQN